LHVERSDANKARVEKTELELQLMMAEGQFQMQGGELEKAREDCAKADEQVRRLWSLADEKEEMIEYKVCFRPCILACDILKGLWIESDDCGS
jgi:hypothetical protein